MTAELLLVLLLSPLAAGATFEGLHLGGALGAAKEGDPPPQAPAPRAVPRPREGPEAVLDLIRTTSGPKNPNYKPCCHAGAHAPVRRKKEEEAYPGAKPIPFAGLKNIVPMTKELWSPEDILKDFAKNKAEGQEAALVIVKTEACQLSESRVCSAATAAIELRSTPALAKFRVYGAWIKNNPDQQGREWTRWHDEVAAAYRFQQGPGAHIIVLVPGVGRPFESDAGKLGLTVESLEKEKGRTPLFETFLQEALESGGAMRRRRP